MRFMSFFLQAILVLSPIIARSFLFYTAFSAISQPGDFSHYSGKMPLRLANGRQMVGF
jgi:hypothetical protein